MLGLLELQGTQHPTFHVQPGSYPQRSPGSTPDSPRLGHTGEQVPELRRVTLARQRLEGPVRGLAKLKMLASEPDLSWTPVVEVTSPGSCPCS